MGKKTTLFVDKDNQIILKSSPEAKPVKIKGKFTTDNNNLIYFIKEPSSWRRQYQLPQRLEFKGRWKLNSNQDLVLDLQDEENFGRCTLTIKGKILTVNKDFLDFQIKTKQEATVEIIHILRIKGTWQADSFNRITFEVERKINPETLIFEGVWEINKNQKITYCYEKINLKTKTKIKESLVFDGFWQITKKDKLRYILINSYDSYFDFKVQVESSQIYPKEGEIKYRLGIGLREDRRFKIISLFGTWKLGRKGEVNFDMDYGKFQKLALNFLGSIKLSSKKELILNLKDLTGRSLGISLLYKRKLFSKNKLEYFLQLKNKDKNFYIGAGATLRF
ncbi:MAG: hypothetical protein KBB01_01895 [Candidatus Omnitrophica bacterium]|jgi:hypothetical protein|nr:hypothetical protein [Candidatus Omnitrophota bacterium]